MSKKVMSVEVEDAIVIDAVDAALASDVVELLDEPIVVEPEMVVDEPVTVVEATKPVATSNRYIVQDGDSYASLGALLTPKGMTGFKYAQTLMALNGGKTLITGSEIRLG